jgi:hypothetical protein
VLKRRVRVHVKADELADGVVDRGAAAAFREREDAAAAAAEGRSAYERTSAWSSKASEAELIGVEVWAERCAGKSP